MKNDNRIFLKDLIPFDDRGEVKIRFNTQFDGNWNPAETYTDKDEEKLLGGHYHNYSKHKSFKEGQITIGFLRLPNPDEWLLFHVGKVTKDLNVFDATGYEYEKIEKYEKYVGRLIIRFKNRCQQLIRKASTIINECEVIQILKHDYDDDIFPGYDNVRLSWEKLKRVLEKDRWQTALQNQKGVYLITDCTNNKMYVGSAYGKDMILGRWRSYVKTGHGGNIGLKKIEFDHIKKYFKYSILDIYKSTTADDVIIRRENWWKETLNTRNNGYNEN